MDYESNHLQFHLGCQINLRCCPELHCLECLNDNLQLGSCIHNSNLTYYEMSLIPILIRDLQNIEDERISYKICSQCSVRYNHKLMLAKRCDCYECFNCLKTRYEKFGISCSICNRVFTTDEIEDLAEANNCLDLEPIQICNQCGLAIYHKGFSGDQCYVCSEFNENSL